MEDLELGPLPKYKELEEEKQGDSENEVLEPKQESKKDKKQDNPKNEIPKPKQKPKKDGTKHDEKIEIPESSCCEIGDCLQCGLTYLPCIFHATIVAILITIAVLSCVGIAKFGNNYELFLCPMVGAVVTGVEQVSYTNGTILHLDIGGDKKIIEHDYSILVIPKTAEYKNGNDIMVYKKCYDYYGLKSSGYALDEQFYEKQVDTHKLYMSVAGLFISGIILSLIFGALFGPCLIQKN